MLEICGLFFLPIRGFIIIDDIALVTIVSRYRITGPCLKGGFKILLSKSKISLRIILSLVI